MWFPVPSRLAKSVEVPVRACRNLLSPISIRNRTFRNRVVSTAHAPSYAEGGKPAERYQAYHEEKARGEIGLTMFGGSSNVSRDSGSIYGQIFVGDDSIIPVFRAFADRVHRHGAGLMCQITHMGRRTGWAAGDWLPTMGPSVIRDPAHRSVPCEITARDIARIVRAFADSAMRCREGGPDGGEILATTHLLDSPCRGCRTPGRMRTGANWRTGRDSSSR